jgi:hypothetical protein
MVVFGFSGPSKLLKFLLASEEKIRTSRYCRIQARDRSNHRTKGLQGSGLPH